jgi:hypothetical protein
LNIWAIPGVVLGVDHVHQLVQLAEDQPQGGFVAAGGDGHVAEGGVVSF